MIGKGHPSFWTNFDALPEDAKELAKKAYAQWKTDPRNASLEFKHLGKRVWSVRIGAHYRALARESLDTEDGEKVYRWYWIGTHEAYNNLLGKKPPPSTN